MRVAAVWLVVLLAGIGVALPPPATAGDAPLRVAITPVLVERHLDVNKQWVNYVGQRLGRPAELVQRRSYKEISDLLERSLVDVAFVCGLPYVLDHAKFGLELLVAPVVYGAPIYYSYVIVPADSPITRFEDLRGRRYAFSDPLSNSGYLVPTYMLARMGQHADGFFKRYIFTYSHSASIEAVAVKFVDAASVDSYVYDHLTATNPRLAAGTRIIDRSPPHGITPVVIRKDVAPELKQRIRRVFLEMDRDPKGREILDHLMITRFVTVPDGHYDSIRDMLGLVDGRWPGSFVARRPPGR